MGPQGHGIDLNAAADNTVTISGSIINVKQQGSAVYGTALESENTVTISSTELNITEDSYGVYAEKVDNLNITMKNSHIRDEEVQDAAEGAIYFLTNSDDNQLTIAEDTSITTIRRPALKLKDSVVRTTLGGCRLRLISQTEETAGTVQIDNTWEGHYSLMKFNGGEIVNNGNGPAIGISDETYFSDRYIPEDPADLKTTIKAKSENAVLINGQPYDDEELYETVQKDDGYYYFQPSKEIQEVLALAEQMKLATPSEVIVDEEILDEDLLYGSLNTATSSEAQYATPSEGDYATPSEGQYEDEASDAGVPEGNRTAGEALTSEKEDGLQEATESEAVYEEDPENGTPEEENAAGASVEERQTAWKQEDAKEEKKQ